MPINLRVSFYDHLLRTPVILDGRNIWVAYKLAEQGFEYAGIGIRNESA